MKLKFHSETTLEKETIDEISLENKVCNLQIYIVFSKTQVAQLMVSQINFFYQRDIRSANSNLIPCQEVENW